MGCKIGHPPRLPETVMLENGTVQRQARVGITREHLTAFGRTLVRASAVVARLRPFCTAGGATP